jgi:hypothetical protein
MYQVLSIATSVLTLLFGGLLSLILKGIKDSIDKVDHRVTAVDDRVIILGDKVGTLEKEFYYFKGEFGSMKNDMNFTKGLIQGRRELLGCVN